MTNIVNAVFHDYNNVEEDIYYCDEHNPEVRLFKKYTTLPQGLELSLICKGCGKVYKEMVQYWSHHDDSY